ncbi:MAG: ABC transporter ATP-binding protein [Pseudomonadota bacterium]
MDAWVGTNGNGGLRKEVIKVTNLTVGFGDVVILEDLDVSVYDREILGVVGASGTGKSVLLRTILGLNPKRKGRVHIMGVDYDQASDDECNILDQQLGVLFQHGALFSSLTVRQNIQVPMREYFAMEQHLMDDLALMKMDLVGLSLDAADKFPSELSGGMIKRAALARALSIDPAVIFLDEPTSGLDPIGAQEFDRLIMNLRDTLGVTVFMVTHDLDSLFATCDRIAVLGQKRVLVAGKPEELLEFDDPWVNSYFNGDRARRARGVS